MRFWDASAVVPLCVAEPTSSAMRSTLREDASMVVWWATRTECISALVRRLREGVLGGAAERNGRRVLIELAEHWAEVQPSDALRRTAERLLAVHALRTSDAFQLAAALEWCGGQTGTTAIVALDGRLREAAHREGFLLFPRIDGAAR